MPDRAHAGLRSVLIDGITALSQLRSPRALDCAHGFAPPVCVVAHALSDATR